MTIEAARWAKRGALALVAGVAVTLGTASVASAADEPITWEDPSSLTVEYGQYWSFLASAPNDLLTVAANDDTLEVTMTPGGYSPDKYAYGFDPSHASITQNFATAPLAVGNYSISLTADTAYNGAHGETATPATLVVAPAALGIESRVVADPSNGENLIVSARFTGRFVEEYTSSAFAYAGVSPAGTWKISIVDSAGGPALDTTTDRAAGDDTLATSFYWDGAEPGEQYIAKISFVPSGASATNFTVAAAPDFPFTAPDVSRAIAESTATTPPAADLPAQADLTIPFWLLLLMLLVTAAASTLIIIFAVKLRRPSALDTEKGEANAAA